MRNPPPSKQPITARCPIRTTLELVGGKWKLLLLFQLYQQPQRWSSLKKQLPDISEKMLTQELNILVDSLLIERVEQSSHSFYRLTDKGKAVWPLLQAMRTFAQAYEASTD